MLEVNGLKYSREQFADYKNRAIAVLEKDKEYHRLDVYTTDTNRFNLIEVLKASAKKGVRFVRLDHWCTKEQDDRDAELISDWLSEA